MAINTTRLSTTLGKIVGALNEVNTYRGGTLQTRATTLAGRYTSVNPDLASALYSSRDSGVSAMDSWVAYLRSLATATIIAEVQNDRPLVSADLTSALTEWRRQMLIAADSFNACPPTLVTATVSATGNPTIVTSALDGSGVAQDTVIPDVYLIQCTADKDNGGTKYTEQFTIRGKTADTATTNFGFPSGSGYSGTLNAINPAASFGIVTDGGFASWNGGSPNSLASWTAGAGCTYATQLVKAVDDPRDGAAGTALALVGDGTALPSVKQQVTVAAGTTYAVHLRVKKILDPGTDWGVTVRLVDGSGTLVGTAVTSVTCSSLSADWLNVVSGTIVTPATLPAAVYLEVKLHQFGSVTTAPAATSQVYVDHLSVVASTPLYAGGPRVTIFSGSVASVALDSYTLTVTITGTLSDYLIRGIDRLVNLRTVGVRLPTDNAGGETQADSLVS